MPNNNGGRDNGTTEWTKVASAAPMFTHHRQPRLPADLGFYDLRLPEVRRAQADLARRYGITAFSYQFHWLSGRRRQERSPDELLVSAIPDFPFMVCWANEAASRDGEDFSEAALLPQDYPPEWERQFAADVAALMRDRRYLRLNGRSVLAIQRMAEIPGPARAMRRLRAFLAEEGFPQIHLIGGLGENKHSEAEELNLDAYFEWPPCNLPARVLNLDGRHPRSVPRAYDYNAMVEAKLDELAAASEAFRNRAVMTGWDDTARRGSAGSVFHGATPTNLRRWLRATIERSRAEARDEETLVFINAWNDWADGAYLEPDRDFGHGWLEAVASTADQPTIATLELWDSHS